MKFTKMSLVAALLVSSSAFAVENIKVDGDVKVFYSTDDAEHIDAKGNKHSSLFNQNTSLGEVAVNVGISADLTTGVSAGATLSGITTLGLENNMVAGTFTGNVKTNAWFNEAWLAGTYGETTGKLGRIQLDTPLVFSETWSMMPSTFESVVLINQDIPDTTIVGAYVGKYNANAVLGGGYGDRKSVSGVMQNPTTKEITLTYDTDARNDVFQKFYNGAYAVGAINNSWEPLTVQAWYYDAQDAVKAVWVQADLNLEGFMAGAQYTRANWSRNVAFPNTLTDIEATRNAAIYGDQSNDAYAAMIGYEMEDTFSAKVSYSSVGKEVKAGMGAGGNLAGSQSKLYTEAWWYYGKITQADTKAMNFTITAPVSDLFDTGLYVTRSVTGKNGSTDLYKTDDKFLEATFEVAKSFGPLDVGLYYIYTKSDSDNILANDKLVQAIYGNGATVKGKAYSTVQVYLTYNF